MNKNPIFIGYYSHENCYCYKVENPWTEYRKENIVLCRISDGLERATEIAKEELTKKMNDALAQQLSSEL